MTKSEIRAVRSLADKQGRTELGAFIAEGAKLVDEICASQQLRTRKIYVSSDAAARRFAGAERIAPAEMERISRLATPADVLAVVEIPRHDLAAADASHALVLALDGVQNPGNLGTLIRLADWFGIGDVVCSPDCADCFNPKVVQATMGAILRVRVHYTALPEWLAAARRGGAPVYGTFLEGDNLYTTELTAAGIVVMGNEGRGITDTAARYVTRRLLIPPYPADRRSSESLNVAMAAGIICAEFRRQALLHR